MDGLIELRDFLLEQAKDDKSIIEYANMLEFTDSYHNVYRILHQDCKRGLWRYMNLFPQDSKFFLRCTQCVFENYFVQVWMNLPKSIHQLYYQGVTDYLELVFGSFYNFNRIMQKQEWFKADEDDYEPFFGDVGCFFFTDLDTLVKCSILVLRKVFAFNQFDLTVMQSLTQQLFHSIKTNDKDLYTLIEPCDKSVIGCFVFQYINSFFLHNTNHVPLSAKFIMMYLQYDNKGLIYIIQYILYICAHNYAPQLNKKKMKDELEFHVAEPVDIIDPQTTAIEILSHSVDAVLTNGLNCRHMCEVLDKFNEVNLKNYKYTSK
ncbi:Transmembrane_domain-containing protein [Hexamita inflata]|uniref:Transmembrane domain-containing protein n=1 Tax=Hexamita inflata TaxID=28002 RepID=A0AA86RH21_9EUKA|nr:Transmembrane domain-containing protein [Hexamita inflata]